MYRIALAAVTVFATARAWMRDESLFMAIGGVAAHMFCVSFVAAMSVELTDLHRADTPITA